MGNIGERAWRNTWFFLQSAAFFLSFLLSDKRELSGCFLGKPVYPLFISSLLKLVSFFFLPQQQCVDVPGPGIKPCHTSHLSCCSDNIGSLTCCATRDLLSFFLYDLFSVWYRLLRSSWRLKSIYWRAESIYNASLCLLPNQIVLLKNNLNI